MPEHVGQLRLALHQRQRAARDVHEPAWRGQRVDAVGVEHDEAPLQAGPGAGLREHAADQRHVLVDGRVLHDAVPLPNALADRFAQLGLFLVGHLNVAHLLCTLQHRPELTGLPLAGAAEPAAGPEQGQRRGAERDHDRDFMCS